MPYDFWKEVDDDRFFDGALWTSNLSIDFVARNFALFSSLSCGLIATRSTSADITVIYPDDWALDATFADMKLVLQIGVEVTAIGTGTLQISGGSNVADFLSTGFVFLTRDYLIGALPTGATTEQILHSGGAGPGSYALAPSDGPIATWQLVPV